jgi:hypothetical protein
MDPIQLILRKGFGKVVEEVASLFEHAGELLSPTIKILISLRDSIDLVREHNLQMRFECEGLERIQVQAIMSLCYESASKFNQVDFEVLKDYLMARAHQLESRNVQDLMESLAYICTKQPDQNVMKASIASIFSIPFEIISKLDSEVSGQNRDQLVKVILMLIGSIKAMQDMDKPVMDDTLTEVVHRVWPHLSLILHKFPLDSHLVASVCTLIQRLIDQSGEAIA